MEVGRKKASQNLPFVVGKVAQSEKHVPILETIDERHTFNFAIVQQCIEDSARKQQEGETIAELSTNYDSESSECLDIIMQKELKSDSSTASVAEAAQQEIATEEADEEVAAPVKEPVSKKPLNTPTRLAINARRVQTPKAAAATVVDVEEVVTEEADEEVAAPVEEPVSKKPLNTPTRLAINARRVQTPKAAAAVMKTPLRLAIQARRQSTSAKSVIPVDKTAQVAEEKVCRVAFSSLIKDAIHARRKSFAPTQDVHEAPTACSSPSLEVEKKRRPLLKTPLRNAIHARRISSTSGASSEIEKTAAASSVASAQPRAALNTHLLEAIHARRQSRAAPLSKSPVAPAPAAKRASLATPLRLAIQSRAERVGASDVRSEAKQTVRPALKTPLRAAIQARRENSSTPVLTTRRLEGAFDSLVSASSAKSVKKRKVGEVTFDIEQTLQVTVQAPDSSAALSDSECVLTEDSLLAAALQISAAAIAHELELQGFSEEDSAVLAVESVVSELNTASTASEVEEAEKEEDFGELVIADEQDEPVSELADTVESVDIDVISVAENTPQPKARRRESLLRSLEKRAAQPSAARVAQLLAVSQESFLADIIEHLSEAEMEVVEQCAAQLESASRGAMDSDEAFAEALDAYVKGIESCYAQEAEASVKSVSDIAAEQPAESACELLEDAEARDGDWVAVDSVVRAAVTAEGPTLESVPSTDSSRRQSRLDNEGATLRSLFLLPEAFTDANDDSRDELLVERYAEELQQIAAVHVAIAFSVALDTFLADPVAFRHNVGLLSLPRPLVVARKLNKHIHFEAVHSVVEPAVEEPASVEIFLVNGGSECDHSSLTAESEVSLSVETVASLDSAQLQGASDADNTSNVPSASETLASPAPVDPVDEVETVDVVVFVVQTAAFAPVTQEVEPVKGAKKRPREKEEEEEEKVDDKPTETARGSKKAKKSRTVPASEPIAASEVVVEEVVEEVVESVVVPVEESEVSLPVEHFEPTSSLSEVTVADSVAILTAPSALLVSTKSKAGRKKSAQKTVNESPGQDSVEVESSPTIPLSAIEVVETVATPEVVVVAPSTATASRKGKRKAVEVDISPPAVVEVTVVETKAKGGRKRTVKDAALETVTESTVIVDVVPTISAKRVRHNAPVDEPEVVVKATASAAAAAPKKAPKGRGTKSAAAQLSKQQQNEEEEEFEEALAILCDGCDQEYFMDEIGLAKVPKGDWFCAHCVSSRGSKGANKTAKAVAVAKSSKRKAGK
eukprot:gene21645-27685_t